MQQTHHATQSPGFIIKDIIISRVRVCSECQAPKKKTHDGPAAVSEYPAAAVRPQLILQQQILWGLRIL
jgi:hypothetical protein